VSEKGTLFVVSAPSGCGKGSIVSPVLAKDEHVQYSVSATTRPARDTEVEGEHYVFLGRKQFMEWAEGGRFVEWADVHGNYYGTIEDKLEEQLASGLDVILELDVQGMHNLKDARKGVVSVFIMPPSLEELERRLRDRGQNNEEEIQTRLGNARTEIESAGDYDYTLVNDVLEDAVAEFESIIRNTRRACG